MVHLVALAEPAQDAEGALDRRLVDEHGLETPLQGRVFLDVLSVLVERRRPDGAELAAREGGLQQVGGVDRALRGARADQRVELVDEQDDLAVGAFNLLEHSLQAVLELASELGAGDQGAQVEGDHPLALQSFGNVTLGDALGEALRDRGLADARLTDEHGVVLRPPGQDLDDAADLFVAADDRIELAVFGQLGQVTTVLLEGLVLGLRVLIRDALVAANLAERAQQRLVCGSVVLDDRHVGEREQHVLGRDVLVLQALGLPLRLLEVLAQRLAQVGLTSSAADLRESLDGRDERRLQRLHGRAGSL